MHEPQLVGHVVRLTYLEGLALGLALLIVFGGVAGLISYLHVRKGINELASLLVFGIIVTAILFLTGWPR
jgi:hypothetical protein